MDKQIMKKCKNCKAEFTPIRFNQKYCLEEPCIKVWVNSQKEKEWKREERRKEGLVAVVDAAQVMVFIIKCV